MESQQQDSQELSSFPIPTGTVLELPAQSHLASSPSNAIPLPRPSSTSNDEPFQQSPQPSPSRRRTSSFGFGTSFFSNLTSSLRNGSYSTTSLQSRPPQQQQQSRSRAGSSSRLNLLQSNALTGSNTSSPRIRNNNSTPMIPIITNDSSDNLDPMNVGTPIEEIIPDFITPANPTHKLDSDGTYSIRLTPFIDHSSNTQGLYFSPVLRKAKPNSKLSIGRYTDKVRTAAQAPPGSDAPVVFKSKVVSRTHAEFYVDGNGNWFVKDLKSSSGTFLNHMRLSPAGVESSVTALQNGDVLQLGMDFRGGIEDVFRCVKMRVEVNKSWQRKANQFNKEAHERLRALALLDDSELSECAICLLKIKPCQSIFISPCSHCWHYKCIRPIVIKSYPQFLCPNCRETCDLEADEEESDLEQSEDDDIEIELEKPENLNDADENTSIEIENSIEDDDNEVRA